MTEGDKRLKMQLFCVGSDDKPQNTEVLWSENGFFGEQRSDLRLRKADFPENTLVYVNQGTFSKMKDGDGAFYTVNVILAQILPLSNNPVNLNDYVCKEDEVKILCPVYYISTAKFQGLEERLAVIVVRGDDNEYFLSYGYNPEKKRNYILFIKRLFLIYFNLQLSKNSTQCLRMTIKTSRQNYFTIYRRLLIEKRK